MGSIGERIGEGGDFHATLWCDLTRDDRVFRVSIYRDGDLIDADEDGIIEDLMEILKNDKWMDRIRNHSHITGNGYTIYDDKVYFIAVQPRALGGMKSLEVTVVKKGVIMENHDLYDQLESEHYSNIFNTLMAKSKEAEHDRDKLEKLLQAWAAEHGYRFTGHAQNIITSLVKQKEKHGKHYCPCRLSKTEGNICPCTHVHSDIRKKGHCHCMLFEKDESTCQIKDN